MISACVYDLWDSKEALYLRDMLKAQSRMWQPFLYPQCLHFQPDFSRQIFVPSLVFSFLPVSCSETICSAAESYCFPISTVNSRYREPWQQQALDKGGERWACSVFLLLQHHWRLSLADWGSQREPILKNFPSRACVDCPHSSSLSGLSWS